MEGPLQFLTTLHMRPKVWLESGFQFKSDLSERQAWKRHIFHAGSLESNMQGDQR